MVLLLRRKSRDVILIGGATDEEVAFKIPLVILSVTRN
jgi:hypothetical protein